jgi:hypothetical protein
MGDLSLPDGFERRVHGVIGGFGFEIPLSTGGVFERLRGQLMWSHTVLFT